MNDDLIKFSEQLIETAEAGKHVKCELIRNLADFITAIGLYSAERKVYIGLKKYSDQCYKDYLAKLYNNEDDLQSLIRYKAFEYYAEFYKEEARLINIIIKEYLVYLFGGGGFLNAISGKPRTELFNYLTGEIPE